MTPITNPPYNPAALAQNRVCTVPPGEIAAAEQSLSKEREALMDRAALAGADSLIPAPIKDAGVSFSEPGAVAAMKTWVDRKLQGVPWWVMLGAGLAGGAYLMNRRGQR